MPPKRKAAPTKEKDAGEVEAIKKEPNKKKGAFKKAEAVEASELAESPDSVELKAKKGKKDNDKMDKTFVVEKADAGEEIIEAAKPEETNGDVKAKRGGRKGKDKMGNVEKKEEEPAEAANGDAKSKRGRKNKDRTEDVTNGESKAKKGKKDKEETKKEEFAEDDGVEKDEEESVAVQPQKGKRGKGKKTPAPKVEEGEEEPPKRSRRQVKAPVYEEIDDEMEEGEDEEEEVIVKKKTDKVPGKQKGRGRPRKIKDDEAVEEDKPKGKGHQKKVQSEPSTSKSGETLMNPTETDYQKIDFSCNKENALGKEPNFVISSWNVDGLRAWLKKGGLEYLKHEEPDVFCIQESKCAADKLPEEIKNFEGYEQYWQDSDKDGYAGVALFTRTKPINVKFGIGVAKHDNEGRCVTAEFEKFYVVSVYVTNAGKKLVTLPKRLEWNEAFKTYIKGLDKKKPVIICGDMNVAHSEIDLANPKTNTKNAGFTKEEREGMTEFLADGYVDTYRKFYPEKTGAYTFWTYMMKARSKNVGWRLDYFITSERLVDNICDNIIRSEVLGSDHCPIALFLNI